MRWTEASVRHLMARAVGPTGKVGYEQHVTAKVQRPRYTAKVQAKYHNTLTEVDGIVFGSKLEAKRYGELKLMEKAGAIRALKVHTHWPLELNGARLCVYVDDFNYVDTASEGSLVVEDCKGVRTPLYTLKKRLMRAIHGITITEIV